MRIAIFFGGIAAIWLSTLMAQSYDSLLRTELARPTDLSPTAFAATGDGALWMAAKGGNLHQLVRLDANGSRSVGLYLPSSANAVANDVITLFALADGGVLELNTDANRDNYRCNLRRFSSTGELKFLRRLSLSVCTLRFAKPGLAPFLLDDTDSAELIAEDGSLISRFETENIGIEETAFTSNGQEMLFLLTDGTPSGHSLVSTSLLSQPLWKKPVRGENFLQNYAYRKTAMQVLADARILFVAITDTGVQERILSSSGEQLETRETLLLAPLKIANFGRFAQDGEGNYALSLQYQQGSDKSYGALMFSPSGRQSKRLQFSAGYSCAWLCPQHGFARGFASVLTTPSAGKLIISSAIADVATIERDLGSRYAPIVANGFGATLLLPTDSTTGKLRAFDYNGVEVAPPDMANKGFTNVSVGLSEFAEDGTHYVVTAALEGLGSGLRYVNTLNAYAANGALLWQKEVPVFSTDYSTLHANAARVCLYTVFSFPSTITPSLLCFASKTGVELSNNSVPNVQLTKLRFLDDGRLRFVGATSQTLEIVDISTANVTSKKSVPLTQIKLIASVGAHGSTLVARGNLDYKIDEWLLFSSAGELVFRKNLPVSINVGAMRGEILTNGNILLAAQGSATESISSSYLNSDGNELWRAVIPNLPGENVIYSVLSDASRLYLLGRNTGSFYVGSLLNNVPVQMRAVSLSDGRLLWTQALNGNVASFVRQYAASNPNEILVSTSEEFGVRLHRLSTATGAILEQRLLDCANANCALRATSLGQDGEFRSLSSTGQYSDVAILLGRSATRSTTAEIALDQPGLSGAWYTPQLGGQGFFLEYFPDSKLLFAPWFTFSHYDSLTSGEPSNSNSPSNLRWYTLTGTLQAGATVARLEIRRNTNGVFDSVPITQSSIVGQAVLRAQDCNRANLEFEFYTADDEDRRFGLLPLARLTGGGAPCRLSNAQVLPGRDARMPRAGFDSRQSGAWFKPATAGQGLMMTVQPATSSTAGFFFAGWFTYDVGGRNDPTAQHWLTLSGEIRPDAQAGVVPVTIYRTLGGRLASVATQNSAILGFGSVTFNGCDRALLRYQFDDALIAGPFRARSGEMALERLAACPAQ
jgi:hypothetical protein